MGAWCAIEVERRRHWTLNCPLHCATGLPGWGDINKSVSIWKDCKLLCNLLQIEQSVNKGGYYYKGDNILVSRWLIGLEAKCVNFRCFHTMGVGVEETGWGGHRCTRRKLLTSSPATRCSTQCQETRSWYRPSHCRVGVGVGVGVSNFICHILNLCSRFTGHPVYSVHDSLKFYVCFVYTK